MDITEIRNLSNEDLAKTIRETEIWDENISEFIYELFYRAGMSNEAEIIDPEYVFDLAEEAAQKLNVSLGTDFSNLLAYGYVDHDTGDTVERDEYNLSEYDGKLFLDTVYNGSTATSERQEVDMQTAKQLIQQYNMSFTEKGANLFSEQFSELSTESQEKSTDRPVLNAEWIPYMKAYRLYDPHSDQQTIAYEDSEEAAEKHAIENGYDGIIICDADTMHVERDFEPIDEKAENDGRYNESQPILEKSEKNSDKHPISQYEKFDKKAFTEKFNEIRQTNKHTLFPLAYMVSNYASKLNDLKLKQDIIDHKISRREHRAEQLETKAVRRENTNKMFDDLYAGKKKPAIIKAIYEKNEQKIANIRDNKIPRNQLKLERQKTKSIANRGAIRLKFAQIDKMQSLSNVIKSFVIIDPDKRRDAFTKSLDGLHDASKRALQCKIEKADIKIEKLTEKMFAKSEKYIDTYSLEEKITKQSERKNTLSQKLDKLQSLDKPFAQQEDKIVDSISEDVKLKVDELEQNPEAGEVKLSEFAEDLAVSCTETANEMNRTAEKEKAAPSADKPSVFKEVEKIKSEKKTVQADKPAPTKEKKPVSQEEI